MDPLLAQRFPELAAIDDPLGRSLLDQAQRVSLPAGQRVFGAGDPCANYLLVVAGSVKVLTRGQNGREIVLYRIENRGSCVLTTSCLLGASAYPAEGITETAVEAFMIPQTQFQQALERSPALRAFIFKSYGERLSDLIRLVQEVAFERIDLRLARYLLHQARDRVELHCTHQQLATELGSAREVISRQLKQFEKQGWISLGRGSIRVDRLEGLERFLLEQPTGC